MRTSGDDVARIRTAMDDLKAASHAIAERLYTAASTHIDAVTADDCHIVWEVAKPPQLLLRGR